MRLRSISIGGALNQCYVMLCYVTAATNEIRETGIFNMQVRLLRTHFRVKFVMMPTFLLLEIN